MSVSDGDHHRENDNLFVGGLPDLLALHEGDFPTLLEPAPG